MSEAEKYGNEPERIKPVWVPDENTMWDKATGESDHTAESTVADGPAENSADIRQSRWEANFGSDGERQQNEGPFDPFGPRHEIPKRQTPPPEPKPKGHFLKTAIIVVAGIMLMFSTVTSGYLLFSDISAKNAIPRLVQSSKSTAGAEKSAADETRLSVSEINEKISPSVVLITGKSMVGAGQGTGIIVSDNGYIMTNAHVVSGFSELTVTLNNEDETEYPATVAGIDSTTDLAVIKINATGLAAAELGTSADLKVGDDVVVIGNPLGQEFSGSVTTGIISALNREVKFDDGQVYCYIQTDAAINSGNSGGPLVNMQGQVIGINSAKIASTVAEGMGFAIPIDDALPVVNDLMEYGYVKNRPYIGISGESLGEQYTQFYNLPVGVHVTSVDENGPAAQAGVQIDDIITEIEGTAVTSVGELNQVKNKHVPGDTVKLKIYRYSTKEELTLKVVLAEMTQDIQ